MPRLEELYLSSSELPGLHEEFYRYYDHDYWIAKIEMHDYLLEHLEDVFEDDEYSEEDIERYESLVRAEYHYIFYHSTEALLGLINSISKDGIPWIDLKESRSFKIDNFVKEELQDDEFEDELREVFYPAIDIRSDEQEEEVSKSTEFFLKYLRMIGSMYSERTVYNEYKHGLRLMTSEREISFQIGTTEGMSDEFLDRDDVEEIDEGVSWTTMDDEVLFFLDSTVIDQDEDTEKKFWSLSRKVKAMEFDLYRRLCVHNAVMIHQIFDIRRKILDIDEDDFEETNVKLYSETDIDEVFEAENSLTAFSINSYYPKSDEDLAVYEVR